MNSDHDNPVVLFVDDSAADRTRGVGLLRRQREHWTIVPMTHVSDALDYLERSSVDAVVSDLIMPDMDGHDLLKIVRDRYIHIPLILVTSKSSPRAAADSIRLGAAGYVPKTQLPGRLADEVESALRRSAEHRLAAEVMRHVTSNEVAFRIEARADRIRSLVELVRSRLLSGPQLSRQHGPSAVALMREMLALLPADDESSSGCPADSPQLEFRMVRGVRDLVMEFRLLGEAADTTWPELIAGYSRKICVSEQSGDLVCSDSSVSVTPKLALEESGRLLRAAFAP